MSHYDKIIINEREYDFFIGIFSFFILTVYLYGYNILKGDLL